MTRSSSPTTFKREGQDAGQRARGPLRGGARRMGAFKRLRAASPWNGFKLAAPRQGPAFLQHHHCRAIMLCHSLPPTPRLPVIVPDIVRMPASPLPVPAPLLQAAIVGGNGRRSPTWPCVMLRAASCTFQQVRGTPAAAGPVPRSRLAFCQTFPREIAAPGATTAGPGRARLARSHPTRIETFSSSTSAKL